MVNRFSKKIVKLSLNLSILGGLALLIRFGYQLFTGHSEDPLMGAMLLILGFVAWILVIRLSKSRSRHYWFRYRGTKPGFKLTTFSVIVVLLVFAFAGVQPVSTYKDNFVGGCAAALPEDEFVPESIPTPIPEPTPIPAPKPSPTPIPTPKIETVGAERLAFDLINLEREKSGLKPTRWGDELYGLSKEHTEAMADSGYLFHSPMGADIAENCWGGYGYGRYDDKALAKAIVESWMSSPLHRAWILHGPIKESVVSIVSDNRGQYASWSFWICKLSGGPGLVEKVAEEWRSSGSDLDWIPWLRSKGYL